MTSSTSATPADSTSGRIVAAGIELLESEGIDGVGLRAIARRAGVSHGAPRRYFPTHRSLLASMARSGLEDLAGELGPILGSDCDPRTRLFDAASAYVDFAVRRRAMFALMFRHDILDGAGGDLRSLSVPLLTELRRVLDAAIDTAPSGKREAPMSEGRRWRRAVTLWTSIHGIAVLASTRALDPVADIIDLDVRELLVGVVEAAIG
ncbi:TetR/AcrR family transcriptional regulator [Gordonia sp. VNQ95]|uniref:TetR/AcrR family transcriptional regulator n=1 Tax=Gordonia TaxID=2053 RepID=UPI0032B35574